MIRCCLCREIMRSVPDFEPTDLPGSGWRCRSHEKCRERVAAVVSSHEALADIMNPEDSP